MFRNKRQYNCLHFQDVKTEDGCRANLSSLLLATETVRPRELSPAGWCGGQASPRTHGPGFWSLIWHELLMRTWDLILSFWILVSSSVQAGEKGRLQAHPRLEF